MDIIKFFNHETNARNDAKLVRLLMNQGVCGIGIYWCIVEMLYQADGRLMLSECDRIAFELRTDSESIASVINNYGLFDVSDGIITCKNATCQIEKILANSQKASESAKARWANNADNKQDMRTQCERNANALQPQCEGNANNNNNKNNKSNKKKNNNTFGSAQNFSFKKSLLDNGADEKLADDWMKVRKELKATNTETALDSFLNEVKKSGHTINEVLKVCIEKSWKGFKASWKVEWDNKQPAADSNEILYSNSVFYMCKDKNGTRWLKSGRAIVDADGDYTMLHVASPEEIERYRI